jgi:hypothetical protein
MILVHFRSPRDKGTGRLFYHFFRKQVITANEMKDKGELHTNC